MSSQNPEIFSRTRRVLGDQALETLWNASVIVFGVGGVGGYAVEALARSGIGHMTLVDPDRVVLSNVNRQLHATLATVGQYKTLAAKERIASISPDCAVTTRELFYLPDNRGGIDLGAFDYIVDAVDTVSAKLTLAEEAQNKGVPIISAMGAGNKLDASALEVADLYDTRMCSLARIMRKECRRRGITHLKVVYSREVPRTPKPGTDIDAQSPARRNVPGSTAFVPAAAGLIIASQVVMDLTGIRAGF